jgi:hypothetical protein
VRPLAGRSERLPAGEVLSSIHRDVQEALRGVVQPMDVSNLEVRSISRQPDDTIAVEISGREPRPTGPTAWAVAAAATARHIGAPVRLHGRVTIADDTTIEFAQNRTRVAAPVTRALTEAFRPMANRTDLRVAFGASDKADAKLTAQRLAWLADHLNVQGTEAVTLADDLPEDAVRVFLVQLVEASGRPTVSPAAPPGPASSN